MTGKPHSLFLKIKEFLLNRPKTQEISLPASSEPLWKALKQLGTELWLDTGDLEGARTQWSPEISGLTTNNTLINTEIQKGIYDSLIKEANQLLGALAKEERVSEIAFMLNAAHALALVQQFKVPVSVELHTNLAHNVEATIEYGKRYFELCPAHFIIKVPLTPSGLLATRELRKQGIPVNLTLSFSARQNALATLLASPSYVNIFLGRINAFVEENQLGNSDFAGEKVTLASQNAVTRLSAHNAQPTRQIAASIRGGSQIFSLAGLDVFTMPLKAAKEALTRQNQGIQNHRNTDYLVGGLQADFEACFRQLWEMPPELEKSFLKLAQKYPVNSVELLRELEESGLSSLFPEWSVQDLETIARDGKIPRFANFKEALKNGRIGLDALLTQAGLLSFMADQAELDKRIAGLIA